MRSASDMMSSSSCGLAQPNAVMCSSVTIGSLELVRLVVELDDRARQRGAFIDADARRERAGGDVAHHHLERDDLHLANELLAHVQPLDEMGRHADLAELHEQILGDAVVEDALALDLVVLLVVEGGGVVLEVLDERTRLRAFIQNLGLAFVDAAAPVHVTFLSMRTIRQN